MINRLNKVMMKILKKDVTPGHTRQLVLAANMDMLLGFDFNCKVRLRSVFNVEYGIIISRLTGEMIVNISSFIPLSAIKTPKNTSHFIITSAAMETDFQNKTSKSGIKYSGKITLDKTATLPMTVVHNVTPGSTKAVFIVLGLQFINELHKVEPKYLCKQHPLCIVGFDKGED